MIGNDIIDLALTRKQSNWERKGFVDKIFTESEKQFIQFAEDPEIMVWSLWSRKEAAYKIFNRQTKIRAFNPLQFECSNAVLVENHYLGKVSGKSVTYFTKTEITAEWINTIAVLKEKYFGDIYALKRTTKIIKKLGIPYIYKENNLSLKPVSISNHGKFERIISLV